MSSENKNKNKVVKTTPALKKKVAPIAVSSKTRDEADKNKDKRKTKQSKHVSQVAHDQGKSNTCWAYTITTAVRAHQRAMGVSEKYVLPHKTLVSILTSSYGFGDKGLDEKVVVHALNEVCEMMDDCCPSKVTKIKSSVRAAHALGNGAGVLVAGFFLDAAQWKKFKLFFAQHPEGVLTEKDVGKPKGDTSGHMVAIVGIRGGKDSYWKIKNSWGKKFADDGFCRVDCKAIKMEFFYKFEDDSPPEAPPKVPTARKNKGATKTTKEVEDPTPSGNARPSRKEPTKTTEGSKRVKQRVRGTKTDS